jgi:hypothetical protein
MPTMPPCSRVPPGCTIRWFAIAALGLAGGAEAGEFSFAPYAAARGQHDSNVYRFSSQVADVTGTDDTSDRHLRLQAGLEASYVWQQQELRAMAEGRSFRFEEFQHLDHEEHTVGVGFKGGLFSHIKALVELRDERRMASFEDRRTTRLIMERDQAGRGEFALALTPRWQVVTGVRGRKLHTPLPDAPALPQPPPGAAARNASPDFTLHETAYNAGVVYGIDARDRPEVEAPLFLGLVLEYQTIDFSGVTEQPEPPPGVTRETFDGYSLLTLAATARYAVSGLSVLDARFGLALYDPAAAGADSRPHVTGEIGYTRELSAVTELNARLFRRIVPAVATADSTSDNGVSVGARWEPISDLIVLANYAWATSSFEGLSGVAPENKGRDDTVQAATLSVSYPPSRSFHVRVYGSYDDRRSNQQFNEYAAETVGVELSYRWRR